ncbi:hypothetical protein [Chitinimonas naiadis]
MQAHAKPWAYIALLYFVSAVSLGVYMGASHDHTLRSVHAHLNLLGWVSLTLTGVIYHFFPKAGQSRLATAHFWLYNAGMPTMLLALLLLMQGNTAAEPGIVVGSLMTLSAVGLFVVNVYKHRA